MGQFEISRDNGVSWGATTRSQVVSVIKELHGEAVVEEMLNEMEHHGMELPGLCVGNLYRLNRSDGCGRCIDCDCRVAA